MSGDHAKDGLPPADVPDPTVAFTAVEAAEASGTTPAVEMARPFILTGRHVARVDSCRCPDCKYGRRPGNDAVLYAGEDAMLLMINSAIRDGRYEDTRADYERRLHSVHADFDAAWHHARRTLEPAIRAWQRWRAAEDAKQVAA